MSQNKPQSPSPSLLGLKGGGGRTPRTPVDIPLKHKRFSPKIPARLLNISPHGAFVETLPERESRIIDLEFAFPGQQGSFLITCRIQWCNRPNMVTTRLNQPIGMGIEFIRYNRGTAEELAGFLRIWDDLHGPGKLNHLRSIKPGAPQSVADVAGFPQAATVYRDCLYSLHSLDEAELEDSLECSLESLLAHGGSQSKDGFSDN